MKTRLPYLIALLLALLLISVCGGCSGKTGPSAASPASPDSSEPAASHAPETDPVSLEETEPAASTTPEPNPVLPENSGSGTGTRTVTDAAGNIVEVPADISRIAVTPLPWSSVIYAIDGTSEKMVSINPGAVKAVYTGKFLEKLDPDYGSIDTSSIGTDFSINMEEMLSRGVQAVVLWDYQLDEAEQLKALGIAPVMVSNNTLEELQASFTAIGQLLGKEERAQVFNDLYAEAYDYLSTFSSQVETADKPKVLYLRNTELRIQGNDAGSDMFIVDAMRLAGADNVGTNRASVTMEEILTLDPDIILLSWFDQFTPEDLYNNTIDGQDWSQVSAVVNRQVYKTPMGIYRWDAPGIETPLMMKWLARLIQPDIFSEIDMEQELRSFIREQFQYELTEEDVNQILSVEANAQSVPR